MGFGKSTEICPNSRDGKDRSYSLVMAHSIMIDINSGCTLTLVRSSMTSGSRPWTSETSYQSYLTSENQM